VGYICVEPNAPVKHDVSEDNPHFFVSRYIIFITLFASYKEEHNGVRLSFKIREPHIRTEYQKDGYGIAHA